MFTQASVSEVSRRWATFEQAIEGDKAAACGIDGGQRLDPPTQFRDRTCERIATSNQLAQKGGGHVRQVNRKDQQQRSANCLQGSLDAGKRPTADLSIKQDRTS